MILKVGVLGLGKIGLPMARHLLANGFSVAGYDLDDTRLEAAAKLGATTCASPCEVAEQSDLVIVVVGFDHEVMAVLGGDDGVYSGLRDGAVIAVASTVTLDTMAEIGRAAADLDRKIGVLDIPICRGEPAAEAGKLLLLAGGDAETYERCRPAFATFASDSYLLGGLGAGQVGKLVNNLLLWACISANHEGLKLGQALGVDGDLLREALLKSSGSNWALETWDRPRAMPWAEKDMSIVMQEADRARLSLPVCGVVKEAIKAIKIERDLPTPGVTGGPRIGQ
jgi:3-hydroxyisobutyrate dehydrogenase-like beta-hydroxyacid dehydrogenase